MKPFKWYADLVRLAISAIMLVITVTVLVGPVTVIDYSYDARPSLDTFLRFFSYTGAVALSFVFLFLAFRDKTKSREPGDVIAAATGFVLSIIGVLTLYATLGDLWADKVIFWSTQVLLAFHVWAVIHWWKHRDNPVKESDDGH